MTMNNKTEFCGTTAILPGSYDPITLGHMGIIRRAAAMYERVYVALLINPDKNYLFSLEERVKIAEAACADIPNAKVISDEGLLVELCRRLGCRTIIKGLRNSTDFEYEMKMAEYNRALAPECETLFMPCALEKHDISSTLVRRLLSDGDIEGALKLMPDGVSPIIKNRGKNDTSKN